MFSRERERVRLICVYMAIESLCFEREIACVCHVCACLLCANCIERRGDGEYAYNYVCIL